MTSMGFILLCLKSYIYAVRNSVLSGDVLIFCSIGFHRLSSSLTLATGIRYMPYTNEPWEQKLIKMGNFKKGDYKQHFTRARLFGFFEFPGVYKDFEFEFIRACARI